MAESLAELQIILDDSSRKRIFRNVAEMKEGHGGYLTGRIQPKNPDVLNLARGSYELEFSFAPSSRSVQVDFPHPSLIQLKYQDHDDQSKKSSLESASAWRLRFSLQNGTIFYKSVGIARVTENAIKLGPDGLSINIAIPNISAPGKNKGTKPKNKQITVEDVIQDRLELEKHRYPKLNHNMTARHIAESYTRDSEAKLELNRCCLWVSLFQDNSLGYEPEEKKIRLEDDELPDTEIEKALAEGISSEVITEDQICQILDQVEAQEEQEQNEERNVQQAAAASPDLMLIATGKSLDIQNKRHKALGDLEVIMLSEPHEGCLMGGMKMVLVSKMDHSGQKNKTTGMYTIYPVFVMDSLDSEVPVLASDKYSGFNQVSRDVDDLQVRGTSFMFRLPRQDPELLDKMETWKRQNSLYISLYRELDGRFAKNPIEFHYTPHGRQFCGKGTRNPPCFRSSQKEGILANFFGKRVTAAQKTSVQLDKEIIATTEDQDREDGCNVISSVKEEPDCQKPTRSGSIDDLFEKLTLNSYTRKKMKLPKLRPSQNSS